jgi:thiamine transport system substrate-binding protein
VGYNLVLPNMMKYQRKISMILIIMTIILFPLEAAFTAQQMNATSYNQRTGEGNRSVFYPEGKGELIIYTHESFLAWGASGSYEDVMNTAFYDFGESHDVTVTVQTFDGMVEALNTLINQKDNPQADIVIGLDNVLVHQAKAEEVLQAYDSPALADIPNVLIDSLDPEKYLLPVDYGLLALIFDTAQISISTDPDLAELTFDDLKNKYVNDLALQDPTLSSTGLNFLLHQIVYFDKVLDEDWKGWWSAIKGKAAIDQSWSDSWDRVFTEQQAKMLASYATDPAYNDFFNYSSEQNAALIHNEAGEQFGWMQIEGIGIIEGANNVSLAQEYVDYFLSETVQDLIATNNWMFPANEQVTLPPCYDYAITTENVTVLNEMIEPSEIANNYQDWLSEWERLIYGGEENRWWIWVTVAAVSVLLIGTGVFIYYRNRAKIDLE